MKKFFVFLTALLFSSVLFAKGADLLFLQMARSGEIISSGNNTFTVTINHPTAYVSYFTDRPERQYGTVPLTQFIDLWSNKKVKDNFAENPPNAAVVVVNKQGQTQTFVAQVMKPKFKNDELSYTLKLLNNKEKISNERLNHITLFFDHIHWNPGGF